MTATAHILDLYRGTPEHRWADKAPSAIRKSRVPGTVALSREGLEGDRQADLEVHGGPDKALHLYASEHYEDWRKAFPGFADIFQPGGFGENLSLSGATEGSFCIGDILAAGPVRLQISQGRQPCWKLNLHTGNPAMAAAFQKTGKTGWYVRILETGQLQAGDTLELVERPCPCWPLDEVILARFNPKLDVATAKALAGLDVLAEPWRASFAKKARL